jgi:hypothetical protein
MFHKVPIAVEAHTAALREREGRLVDLQAVSSGAQRQVSQDLRVTSLGTIGRSSIEDCEVNVSAGS